MRVTKRILIGLLFMAPFIASSNEQIIAACETCTADQKAHLARSAGMRAPNPGETITTDVYVVTMSDNSINRYFVTSKEEYKWGEWELITRVSAQTPDYYVQNEIQKGLERYKELREKGVSWESLDWGNSAPILSVHEVVRDPSIAINFQRALERTLSRRMLTTTTHLTVKTIQGLLAIPMNRIQTIQFPDGTTIQIELKGIKVDVANDEVKGIEIEIKISTAMDGRMEIPTGAGAAIALNWLLLEGDQLNRFLATARAFGVPITISGSGESMSCSWDGQTLKCRKSSS
ncbi:hypothetical protein [Permianibacter aggregans]|uniref:Uncharacterized protein n=1 Tax=Permianibacter aggregans TaxID=1510150 RepID=A0A4R6UQT2_9GAMM|nr:hypothetical protein [Permianibacter aggregans]QGX40459.1 hypothetical protein E2H98_12585 [Permianibacter aggregans]TDQ49401.1 hypothetical protein EV696_104105 [Permianibacter aggregans]